jgi:hypothetical protein
MPKPSSTVNLSSISEGGDRLPGGKYTLKLVAIEPKKSQADKDMIVGTWEVMQGPSEGLKHTEYYSLVVTEDKNTGAIRAPGIISIKKTLAAAGKALPDDFDFPLDPTAVQKLVYGRLKNVLLTGTVTEYKQKDKETGEIKDRTRLSIVGPATRGKTVATDDEEKIEIEDDPKPAKKPAKNGTAKKVEEVEEEDDEPAPPPKKVAKKPVPVDEDEEEETDDDLDEVEIEEEEDETPPPPRKQVARK